MDWDREERERAIQEADRLLAECERADRQRAQRAKRSAPAEIIRKTYAPRPVQQPQSTTVMDATTQAGWDTWVKNHIALALNEHMFNERQFDAIAEAISILRREERQHMREHVSAELGQLKAEIEILRSIVKSNNVTPIKSDRDAA